MKDRHIAELYKIYIKCPREVINKLVAASISRREATATGLLLAATLVFLLTDENITEGEPSHGHCIHYFSVGIKHNNPKPLMEKKECVWVYSSRGIKVHWVMEKTWHQVAGMVAGAES